MESLKRKYKNYKASMSWELYNIWLRLQSILFSVFWENRVRYQLKSQESAESFSPLTLKPSIGMFSAVVVH